MKRYKVMIIDDQEMARQLFAWYFEGQEDYVVVCQAGTVSFVEEFVKTNQVDVVIMDVLMKDDVNGFVMAKRIKKNLSSNKNCYGNINAGSVMD